MVTSRWGVGFRVTPPGETVGWMSTPHLGEGGLDEYSPLGRRWVG